MKCILCAFHARIFVVYLSVEPSLAADKSSGIMTFIGDKSSDLSLLGVLDRKYQNAESLALVVIVRDIIVYSPFFSLA